MLVLVLSLVAVPSAVMADYSPPSLPDLVLTSDVIVRGTIEALSADTIEVRVHEVAAGGVAPGSTITVARFEDWMCAQRWAPYAMGQEAVFFLAAPSGPGPYQIRSGGGEGEMPLVGSRVCVNGYYHGLAATGADPHERLTIHGGTYVGFCVPSAELIEAVRLARAAFRGVVTTDRYPRLERVHRQGVVGDAADRSLQRTDVGRALARTLSAAAR
jgi:hypothetical protein